jgi:predicted nucleic acid-binding Zn ribbon protein
MVKVLPGSRVVVSDTKISPDQLVSWERVAACVVEKEKREAKSMSKVFFIELVSFFAIH